MVGEEGICRLLLGLRQLHQVFYLKVRKYNIFKYFLMVKFSHIYNIRNSKHSFNDLIVFEIAEACRRKMIITLLIGPLTSLEETLQYRKSLVVFLPQYSTAAQRTTFQHVLACFWGILMKTSLKRSFSFQTLLRDIGIAIFGRDLSPNFKNFKEPMNRF